MTLVPIRRLLVTGVVLAVLGAACGGGDGTGTSTTPPPPTVPGTTTLASGSAPPSGPSTDEIRFTSGPFELVGDLNLPGGDGPHPAVIVVAGSGTQTRTSTPGFALVKDRFTRAGFAVLSWDKPGSGASTGELEDDIADRGAILADGVAFLAARPEIDADRIGLWGLSQAGWVMPYALDLTDGISFMIVVSGGAEPGYDQGVYQTTQTMVCAGDATPEEAALIKQLGADMWKANTYDAYRSAVQALLDFPALHGYVTIELQPESTWEPEAYTASGFFDPMYVVAGTTVPILAVFGENDRFIDPVQGAAAYAAAFEEAGAEMSQVESIPGVGHLMQEQETGCPGEPGGAVSPRYLELLDQWIAMLAG